MKFSTKAIHEGQEPDSKTGAVIVPIFMTSTFVQDGIGGMREGYEYSRTGNPTRAALETTIAALENAKHGLCFSSGSAATAAIVDMLQPGDNVLTTIDVYGGTYRQFQSVYSKYGIDFEFLNTSDADEILARVKDTTKMIWVETPTNPMLNIIDIEKLASGRPAGVRLIVDNTFATPFLQNPLELGADAVAHSVTKYLSGHSDVVGGAIATNHLEIYEACKFYQNAVGGVPSPFDCFLVQRGLKTLEVRMQRHSESAGKIAEFLKTKKGVDAVYYPGLPEHPGHEIAKRQMRGYSGMVSFKLSGGRAAVDAFCAKTKLFTLAESLGGVESLLCYPYTMTHGAIPENLKNQIGITDNLLRLSVGIESLEDLLEDLDQSL